MGIKVITPPTAPVVSLADLRLHIKAGSDTSEDTLLTGWVAGAHEVAQHYTGYAIGSQTLELALDAFPDGAIQLPRGPVTSISSVTYIDADGDSQTVSSGDYTLDDYSTPCWLVPAYDTTWPTTLDTVNAVKVRYVVGSIPSAVKSALLLMVGWLNEHRGDAMDPDNIQPPAAKALLNTVKVWGRD